MFKSGTSEKCQSLEISHGMRVSDTGRECMHNSVSNHNPNEIIHLSNDVIAKTDYCASHGKRKLEIENFLRYK